MNKFYSRLVLVFLIIVLILGVFYLYKHKSLLDISKNIKLENALDKQNIIPVAVIGSGPAGLSAALYTSRAAFHTILFEGPKPGGQLMETTYVENWPGTQKKLGSELIAQNRKQAEKFGTVLVNDVIECVDFSTWPFRLQTDQNVEVNALSVIIATGATPKLLDVPGEKEYSGYGVTSCAVCDAPFYKGKDVVVVGGGDSAIEEATLLASYAKNVTILVRSSQFRAAPAMQERLKGFDNIKVMLNTSIVEILGDRKFVTHIKIKNNKTEEISEMPIDGVFLAIGHEPNTEMFKNFLPLNSSGYIVLSNRSQQTSIPGIFAAGDVADEHYKQAGTAAGDGIKAALDAVEFLQEKGFNDHFKKKIQKHYFYPEQDESFEIQKLVTNKDFDKLAKESKPLVVEVGADFCSSCKVLLSAVKSVAARLEDKVNFAQINLEDEPKELKERFKIESIPALLIFKDGKLVSRFDRKIFSRYELYTLINQLISED